MKAPFLGLDFFGHTQNLLYAQFYKTNDQWPLFNIAAAWGSITTSDEQEADKKYEGKRLGNKMSMEVLKSSEIFMDSQGHTREQDCSQAQRKT